MARRPSTLNRSSPSSQYGSLALPSVISRMPAAFFLEPGEILTGPRRNRLPLGAMEKGGVGRDPSKCPHPDCSLDWLLGIDPYDGLAMVRHRKSIIPRAVSLSHEQRLVRARPLDPTEGLAQRQVHARIRGLIMIPDHPQSRGSPCVLGTRGGNDLERADRRRPGPERILMSTAGQA